MVDKEFYVRVLDIFSGIGGFSLGLKRAGMETVAFCEIEKFPQKILKKHWPEVPIYDDIRKLTRERLIEDGILGDPNNSRTGLGLRVDGDKQKETKNRGRFTRSKSCKAGQNGDSERTPTGTIKTIDVVCGGFPCQPFSQAGKRDGKNDDRDLWPEMFRVIREVRPTWVIGENVAGFVNMELDRTISDLESEAYEVQSFIIPACAINAPHRRDRIWIVARDTKGDRGDPFGGICEDVAHPEINPQRRLPGREKKEESGPTRGGENVGYSEGQQVDGERPGGLQPQPPQSSWWSVEPDVGRVANGVPSRVDRLKGLGNAVVPQIPEIIGKAIMEIEHVTA